MSAAETPAMLARAVAAVAAEEGAALAAINTGDAAFRDGDLCVFCGGGDGRFTAHGFNPLDVGMSMRKVFGKAGMAVGETIYAEAVEGEVRSVEQAFPKPGEIRPSAKAALFTKVRDQICEVGYFR